MIMNMVGGSGEVKPSYKVYGFEVDMTDDTKEYPVSYPKNIFGQLNGASFITTPAYGTEEGCMNDWADCPLISGIKRQIGNATKGWTDIADRKSPVIGTGDDDVMTYVPTWYMRIGRETRSIDGADHDILSVAFSQGQLDENWQDYAGSVGARRIGHFRLGCYISRPSTTALDSKGGTVGYTTIVHRDLLLTRAQARGEGYDLETVYQRWYLAALSILLTKCVNPGKKLYRGRTGFEYQDTQEALSYANVYGMAGSLTERTSGAFFWIQDFWGGFREILGNIASGKTSAGDAIIKAGLGYCTFDTSELEFTLAEYSTSQYAIMTSVLFKVSGDTPKGFYPTKAGFYRDSIRSPFHETAFVAPENVTVNPSVINPRAYGFKVRSVVFESTDSSRSNYEGWTSSGPLGVDYTQYFAHARLSYRL